MNENILLAGSFVENTIRKSYFFENLDNSVWCVEINLRRGAEIMRVIAENLEDIQDWFRQEGGNDGEPVLGEIDPKEFKSWLADNLEDIYTALL